ncbi:SMP-30/gluconolactonase/LRE family protein [Ulvibacterium sp.]|uniref:SMP-30/gluconolactonase/LRE family protein n=1 Tax=Ulvibacterium sp. TaxID=2665914 RepID=UPI002608376D|nr:SMP-30/gluconolactonase/LRE family protein [Ulvibacterium sp.]
MKYGILIATLILILGCDSRTMSEYVLDERGLVPEGIAYSKKKDAFYLTSVAKSKIVEVDRKSGEQKDFIREREFGYTPGVGILVDDTRNLLHALGGYYMYKDSLPSLFTFDIHTKRLLKKYDVTDAGEHFLNDLIQDDKGNLYLTDSKDASIYILKPETDSLELFFKSSEVEFPNGIAISDDNSKLYIASFSKGVRILDISTKRILNDPDTLGISQGIDGLEFYKGHLYAIQNGVRANTFNFRKLVLDPTQGKIVKAKVLDSHTPRLDLPLTFCLVENEAVVIGNSNLQYLNQETFKFVASDTISNTKLLVYALE